MKTKLFMILILLLSFSSVHAKWWIFGGGEEEVGFDYLYINSLSFDDISSGSAMLPINQLEKGALHVRGKARSGKNQIGAISVSLDGAKTWQKASFEKDGGFDFSFEPDTTQSYDIYVKVIDTTGKSNEIEDSHIKVSFTNLDAQATIQETLNHLKTYYEQEDDSNFMRYVSDAFEGDVMTLERALRKDFSVLENITIDFSISGVAFSNNRYYASVYFNRSVDDATTGTSYSDRGVTEFSFDIGEKGAMLLSMKNPLIFGLTYAADIASGTTASAQNSANFITINNNGSVGQSTLADIESGDDANDYMTSGSFSLQASCSAPCVVADGFNFTNDEKTTTIAASEVYKENNILIPNAGVALYDYAADISISGITVPDAGYSTATFADIATIGNVIAAKLPNNTYAVMKVTNVAGGIVYFDYKYNPSGSRTFP
jgi:hypothetical protein